MNVYKDHGDNRWYVTVPVSDFNDTLERALGSTKARHAIAERRGVRLWVVRLETYETDRKRGLETFREAR